MSLKSFLFLIVNVFYSSFAFANSNFETGLGSSILVLETADSIQPLHTQTTLSIACPNFHSNSDCKLKTIDFNSLTYSKLNKTIKNSDIINMSFGYESPYDSHITRPKFQALVAQGFISEGHEQSYKDRKILFETLFEDNTEKLFLTAAGNGSDQHHLGQGGVPLGQNYSVYPAVLDHKNLIKVTAVNASHFNKNYRLLYEVAKYANYSVDHVDVAAPVEPDNRGSFFAVPYVTELANELNERSSLKLLPSEIKKIFQKSCYIQDIETTFDYFRAYKYNRENSVINRIQNARLSLLEREELVESIRPVMLVKCGGVLSKNQALSCAKIYTESNKTKSILDSCLEAYEKEFYLADGEKEKLRALWTL